MNFVPPETRQCSEVWKFRPEYAGKPVPAARACTCRVAGFGGPITQPLITNAQEVLPGTG